MKEFIHILALVFIAKGFVSGGKAIYYFCEFFQRALNGLKSF